MTGFLWEGIHEFQKAMDDMIATQMAVSKVALVTAARIVEREAKTQLGSSSHAKGTPTPSAPGRPPAIITGTLRRSIAVTGPVMTGKDWQSKVGPTTVYGRIQELGGTAGHGNRLPARPYMTPALTKSKAEIEAVFTKAWGLGV